MIYDHFHCDKDQKKILKSTPYLFLTEEEQVNFHFMMHQRLKLRSQNFMASFENNLLASKYKKYSSNFPDFESLDYSKSFIKLKKYNVEEIDRNKFQEILYNDVYHPPLVVKGLLNDTVAVKKWTHQYFLEQYKDIEIEAMDYSDDPSLSSQTLEQKKLKLSEIIRSQLNKQSEKSYYVSNGAEFFENYPHLADEFGEDRILDLFKGHTVDGTNLLFLGNLKTWGTSWHVGLDDISCTLMINGVKQWFFMDPRLTYLLRPCFMGDTFYMGTQMDIRNSLDFHKIHNPLYAYAPKYYFDLEPGDALFYTRHWPHAVINSSPLQIMAIMRLGGYDFEAMEMEEENTGPTTLFPIYDNISNSDPDYINLKFEAFQILMKKIQR